MAAPKEKEKKEREREKLAARRWAEREDREVEEKREGDKIAFQTHELEEAHCATFAGY